MWVETDNGIVHMSDFKPQQGNCFSNALVIATRMEKLEEVSQVRIVHGIIKGRITLAGKEIVHAWVEDATHCYDLEVHKDEYTRIPRDQYYMLGQPRDIRKFTVDEGHENLDTMGYDGPWDPKHEVQWLAERPENRRQIEELKDEC